MVKTTLLVTALAFLSTTAYADIVTVTVTGTIAPYTFNGSQFTSTPLIDNGTFGTHQSLFGASFTEQWTLSNQQSSQVTSALLTINNTTVNIGSGLGDLIYGGCIYPSVSVNHGYCNGFNINLTVTPGVTAMDSFVNSFTNDFPGNSSTSWNYTLNPLTDNLNTSNGIGGGFRYGGISGYLLPETFTVENQSQQQSFASFASVSVPAPIVGAGIPGLLLLILAWLRSIYQPLSS